MFVRNVVMNVGSMNMTIAKIAPEPATIALNNVKGWPHEPWDEQPG
ncbi:hypothetical protein NB714_003467 [Pantoea dispersa]|nr:hypothetical protein [Pantoea dispersa]MCW0327342.1 hypothetical protein [Pantoea dispersa]MCW0433767.1 hypothetical protein [Pantoea dispersa]